MFSKTYLNQYFWKFHNSRHSEWMEKFFDKYLLKIFHIAFPYSEGLLLAKYAFSIHINKIFFIFFREQNANFQIFLVLRTLIEITKYNSFFAYISELELILVIISLMQLLNWHQDNFAHLFWAEGYWRKFQIEFILLLVSLN